MSLITVANGPLAIAGSILSLERISGSNTAITLAIMIVKNIDTPRIKPRFSDCKTIDPRRALKIPNTIANKNTIFISLVIYFPRFNLFCRLSDLINIVWV